MSRSRSFVAVRAAAAAITVGGVLASCNVPGDNPASAPAPLAGTTTGGVLRVGIVSPGGIDPLGAYEPNGELVSQTLCDTLVALDPKTGQLREAVADNWQADDSGAEFDLTLRKGVTFSNGTPVTVSDINGSLQDLVAPANASYVAPLAEALLGAQGTGSVLVDNTGKAATIATTVSHTEVQVTSIEPEGGYLRAFAEPAMAPISQAAYAANPTAFADDPVCVGPYKLATAYKPGATEIRLVRDDHYYGENVGYTSGGKGYASEIDFHIYPTAAAAVTAYLQGKVDVVRVPDQQQSMIPAKDRSDLEYGPSTAVEFLGMPDGGDGPLANADVRTGLSEALNRTQLASAVYGPSATPADGFEPAALAIESGPSLDGKVIKSPATQTCGALTPATPDLAAAKAELAKANVSLAGGITLTVNNDAPYPAMAAMVAKQWEALGINVKVVTQPWATYENQAVKGGGLTTAFRIRWSSNATAPIPIYNDPESYLGPLLAANATSFGNWAQWTDNNFDYDFTQDIQVTDVQQRGLAFNDLLKTACEQMPIIPVVFDRPAYLVRSSAIGLARTNPIGRDGLLQLRELYVKK